MEARSWPGEIHVPAMNPKLHGERRVPSSQQVRQVPTENHKTSLMRRRYLCRGEHVVNLSVQSQ